MNYEALLHGQTVLLYSATFVYHCLHLFPFLYTLLSISVMALFYYILHLLLLTIVLGYPVGPSSMHEEYPIILHPISDSPLTNTIPIPYKSYQSLLSSIFEANINKIKGIAPEIFQTIHELHPTGKELCRISQSAVIKEAIDQLNKLSNDISAWIDTVDTITDMTIDDYRLRVNQELSRQFTGIFNPAELSASLVDTVVKPNSLLKYIVSIWSIFESSGKVAQQLEHERAEAFGLKVWMEAWLLDIEYSVREAFQWRDIESK
ncbi:hypothetical protein BDB01DRAFT_8732 [Pilobolus umbonatus]|nr:hypothetical protein BDB01DRAFT_8732 [Pilobolus umbonatus]